MCSMEQRKRYDWIAIQVLYDEGASITECRQRFGFAYASWRKAVDRGDLQLPSGGAWSNRAGANDWSTIQTYYDEGHTSRECRIRFGLTARAWRKARIQGLIQIRPLKYSLERMLREGRGRTNIKNRLLEAGLLARRCEICGLSEWRGKPLSIQIDHINGVCDDNRLENLRMLCPNCHSQTETFAARNRKHHRSRVV